MNTIIVDSQSMNNNDAGSILIFYGICIIYLMILVLFCEWIAEKFGQIWFLIGVFLGLAIPFLIGGFLLL